MKKLLLVLLCLPIIGFGSCLFNESSLYGKSLKITSNSDFTILESNGTLSEGGSWWISNKKLYVDASWGSTYIYPLDKGLDYGKLRGYWIKDGASESTKKKLSIPVEISDAFKDLFSVNTWTLCIDDMIDEKISAWQKQGEFEKTVSFQKRVNESTRKEMKEKYRKEVIDHFKKEAIKFINYTDISLEKYNPDLETFLINISGYGNFNLPVPISKAPSFKENFNAANFSNLDLIFEDDKFIVSHFEIDGYIYDVSGNIPQYDENGVLIK